MSEEQHREWRQKVLESAWKLTISVTFTLTAFLVSYKEAWFTDTR